MPRKKSSHQSKKSHKRSRSIPSVSTQTTTLTPSHIVNEDDSTHLYRLRHLQAPSAENDAWVPREKLDPELLQTWETTGRERRKRVSFCEVVVRKRINECGNAKEVVEKLRDPEEPEEGKNGEVQGGMN